MSDQHRMHVLEAWSGFHRQAIEPGCDPTLVREFRKMFFAGALAMFTLTLQLAESPKEADKLAEDLTAEFLSYNERLKAGDI